MQSRLMGFALSLGLAVAASGCATLADHAYFNVAENVLGRHKRDIMVDRVEDARDSQEKAAETFKSALEEFREVVTVEGGNIEDKFNIVNSAYEKSASRAEDVRERIDAIERVSGALFSEWEKELSDYQSEALRAKSEEKLEATRVRYAQLIEKMRAAEARMEPVLKTLRDQQLYLKHNLNAAAIAALDTEVVVLENDVAALIEEMEQAIAEANTFIDELEGSR